MKHILILGATSAIAQAAARIWAEEKCSFLLVARNALKLEAVANDLSSRGAPAVHCITSDLDNIQGHSALMQEVLEKLNDIDIALLAYGVLGSQQEGEDEFSKANEVLTTNFLSPCSLLTHLANYFESRKKGAIAVIGSVAGDRGRGSNYIYGSAKGGLALFTQGIRSRLAKVNVSVLLAKPGFTDTPMTAHLPKGILFSSADTVAEGIVESVRHKRDVVYLPWFWRLIMLIIKLIPESIFKKTKL